MDIAEKLKLQQTSKELLLFKEGVFLKAYNESCYILTQQLNHHLKVSCDYIKSIDQWIVHCSFPANKLRKRLPKAELTAFGGKLAGDFNLSKYQGWFETRRHQANEVSVVRASADNEGIITTPQIAPLNDAETLDILLPLSAQQLSYLSNWQKNRYPLAVEQGFIESLKANLALFQK